MNGSLFQQLDAAAAAIREHCPALPEIAIVLGSGLSAVVDAVMEPVVVAYHDLPHWPVTAVEGHLSELVVGRLGDRMVAVLAGRVHLYEGYSLNDVVFATRVMGRLGMRHIILTNAAGGINAALAPGTLMVIDDHINLLGANPLTGVNDERLGPRFPDLTDVYSPRLRALARSVAREHQVPLANGIYAAVQGPSYETPAEVRYLRAIGVDAVGMSLVPEAIAARHMGMEVLGLSCITNAAAGVTSESGGMPAAREVTHDDVLTTAQRVSGQLTDIVRGVVERIGLE